MVPPPPLASALRRGVSFALVVLGAVSSVRCAPPQQPVTTPPPKPVPTEAPAVPSAEASAAPVEPAVPACEVAVPAPPSVGQDALELRQVTDAKGRLDLLGIDGRVLLVGEKLAGPTRFASGGSTWTQPGGAYRNQFFELRDGALHPLPELQNELWPLQDVFQGAGTFPDIHVWSTNYGNTSWEVAHFHWGADKNAWQSDPPELRPWTGGQIVLPGRRDPQHVTFQPSAEALKLPPGLCDDVNGCTKGLVTAPPRDIYVNAAGCTLGTGPLYLGSNCTIDAVLHWCAPRTGFTRHALPAPVNKAYFIAVPGTALVAGESQLVLRGEVWSAVTAVAGTFDPYMLRAAAGVIWYLGEDGVYQLQGADWRRVLPWTFSRTKGKDDRTHYMLKLPGGKTSLELTGFAAEGADALLVSVLSKGRTALLRSSPR